MFRYYIDFNLKNGLGHPSVSLYLTGCDKSEKCEDCHNYELQEESKEDYNMDNIKNSVEMYIDNFLDFYDELYMSFLGGEPLTEYNKVITYEISKYIKNNYEKVINVLYSWRYKERIYQKRSKEISYMDYGVLGPYDKECHEDNKLPSSRNQYIWDFNSQTKIESIDI